jgi:membrane-associated phospholipid phosphatase
MHTYKAIARDLLIVSSFIVAGLLVRILVFKDPNARGFFKNDMSIYHPMADHDTVSTAEAAIFGIGVPLLCMVAVWFLVDRVHKNDFIDNDTEEEHPKELWTGVPLLASRRDDRSESLLDSSGTVPNSTSLSRSSSANTDTCAEKQASSSPHWPSSVSGSPRERKLRFALYQFLVFCFLFAAVALGTDAVKNLVGRLRPDFIARCDPDFSNPDLVYDPDAPWIAAKYAFICRGDDHVIKEGRKSFPSGHATASSFGAVFAVIYLGKRVAARSRRAFGYFFLPFVQVLLLCCAVLIAASRSWDNRHHPLDILLGVAIGAAGAGTSLFFPIFFPAWEYDGSVGKNAAEAGLHGGLDADSSLNAVAVNTDDVGIVIDGGIVGMEGVAHTYDQA